MAFFGFSDYNFGTEGPRDLKFGLLASPGDGLPRTRTISDFLDFGPCITYTVSLSYALKECSLFLCFFKLKLDLCIL